MHNPSTGLKLQYFSGVYGGCLDIQAQGYGKVCSPRKLELENQLRFSCGKRTVWIFEGADHDSYSIFAMDACYDTVTVKF